MATTTTITIKTEELTNYKLANSVNGFGLCGYNPRNGGYVYANEGYGNAETYVSMEELLDMLDEDGMKTTDTLEIVVNDHNQITYIHMDVWSI